MDASRRCVLIALMAAFLVARVTGAHLHLCLDGSEPLAQLHVSDNAGSDHHSDESLGHEDVDVDALGSVLAKTSKLDLPAIALVAWCLTILLLRVARPSARCAVARPPYRPPRFLRPLLRAPPC